MKKRPSNKKIVRACYIFIALFTAILFLAPIVLTITNSFMSTSEIYSNYGAILENASGDGKRFISKMVNLKLLPDMVSFSQYITVLFKTPDYLLKFWNSAILVVPITVFQILIATLASYGFTRCKGKFGAAVFFAYIILMMMPYQVTLVPNYFVLNWLNLLDTKWAIWLPGIFSPFSVYLITKYMKRIPKSLVESARIDGANEWQIFSQIYLPTSKSIITSCVILVFIDYWNMVEQPLLFLSDQDKYPLSIFLSRINTKDIGMAFAVAVIYMIPGLLIYLYGEDALVEGVTYTGSVKE